MEARRDARLSTTIGHEIFESLGDASNSLMSARGAFVQAHKRLDVLRRALNLEPMALAPIGKPQMRTAEIAAIAHAA